MLDTRFKKKKMATKKKDMETTRLKLKELCTQLDSDSESNKQLVFSFYNLFLSFVTQHE